MSLESRKFACFRDSGTILVSQGMQKRWVLGIFPMCHASCRVSNWLDVFLQGFQQVFYVIVTNVESPNFWSLFYETSSSLDCMTALET